MNLSWCKLLLSQIEWGCCLAQLVERVSSVQRLCPRCSGPGFDSRPEFLCCVSLPLSPTLFPVTSSTVLSIKPRKAKKILRKKKKKKEQTMKPTEQSKKNCIFFLIKWYCKSIHKTPGQTQDFRHVQVFVAVCQNINTVCHKLIFTFWSCLSCVFHTYSR